MSVTAERLRKLAAQMRELASMPEEVSEPEVMAKTASVELDPQKVLDFMLFYGTGARK